jgi:hypothetical protein
MTNLLEDNSRGFGFTNSSAMIFWRAQRSKGASTRKAELNTEIEKSYYLNTISEGIDK